MPRNPFSYGSIVTSDGFCPRSALSKRLKSFFQSGQNVVLMGPRRVGKSSLIHEVASGLPKTTLIYADFWGVHTIEDFVKRCVQALESAPDQSGMIQKIAQAIPGISLSVSVDPISGAPSLTPTFTSKHKPTPDTTTQLAKLWASLSSKKAPTIIAFNEFQDVSKMENSDQFLGSLRKEIQLLGDTSFCFSGSVRNEMGRIFADERGPFYKSAAILEVAGDDFDDWHGFLEKRFASTSLKIPRDCLEKITAISRGSPGDTQQLCAAVWELAKAQNQRKISEELVNLALEQIFADERKGYEYILNDITGQQLAVLRSLAVLGGASVQSSEFLQQSGITHASSSKAAATRLLQKRILQESPNGLEFSNPFFRAWLLHAGI